MAKKKQELTVEEKLAAALVREDEQPYEVPGNWVWTRVDSINQYNSATINPLKNSLELFELYSVPSCENDYPEILLGSEIGSTKQIVQKNDVLLCKINPRINRVWIVTRHTENMQIASSEWIVVRNSTIIPKYLLWYFRSNGFRKQLLTNVSGVGGSLMRAQPKYVKTYAIPLPPLAEQQRIVDRIESLFDQLDQAKALIQEALDSFATRKAAILHQAFTGALTKKWRAAHGVGLESWEEVPFNKFCLLKRGYDLPSKERTQGAYPLVSSSGVIDSHYEYKVKGPGIVTGRSGTLGKVYYVEDNYWPLNTTLYSKEIFDNYPRYIYYYLSQFDFKKFSSSTAVPTLNRNNFSEIPILKPKYTEQQEIVRILDDLLEKEQAAFDLCDLIDQIDTIKKTILGKAFRGELGTNVAGEESAVVLLKQVLTENGKAK